MSKPNGVIIDRKYEASFRRMSCENLASLILGLLEYANTGECQSEIGEAALPLFEVMKLDVQRDFDAYEEKCRINAENGKKGGRPRKQPLSEKTDGFLEEAEKGNNKYNNNNNNKYNNNNTEEEVKYENNGNEKKTAGSATDLASRGMVPPPPPPPENMWEELRELAVPLSYAEARLERAEYFAPIERKRVAEIIYEWWQTDRHGTPPNKHTVTPSSYSSSSSSSSSSNKTYDVDEFFEAACRKAEEEFI